MRSGKRKRDDGNSKGSSSRRDPDQESDDSSSEEERVDVKRRKGPNWSEADDKLMKRLKGKGGRWEEIAKSFPGRTTEACQQRYNNHIKEGEKKVNGGGWIAMGGDCEVFSWTISASLSEEV
jgi:hypothetical protein